MFNLATPLTLGCRSSRFPKVNNRRKPNSGWYNSLEKKEARARKTRSPRLSGFSMVKAPAQRLVRRTSTAAPDFSEVFVGMGAFVALVDKRDGLHEASKAFYTVSDEEGEIGHHPAGGGSNVHLAPLPRRFQPPFLRYEAQPASGYLGKLNPSPPPPFLRMIGERRRTGLTSSKRGSSGEIEGPPAPFRGVGVVLGCCGNSRGSKGWSQCGSG